MAKPEKKQHPFLKLTIHDLAKQGAPIHPAFVRKLHKRISIERAKLTLGGAT